MPWIDVFGHLHEIIQSKVGALRWAITAASYAHMEKAGRNSVDASLKEYESVEVRPGKGTTNTQVKHAAYDAMPDEARVLSIGSCLANEGLVFLDRRQHHREWLAEKGISPEDARLRYTAWRAEKDAAKEKRAGGGDPVGGDD
jgi:hypothetical protein